MAGNKQPILLMHLVTGRWTPVVRLLGPTPGSLFHDLVPAVRVLHAWISTNKSLMTCSSLLADLLSPNTAFFELVTFVG